VAALHGAGALVTVHDPLYSDDELRGMGFEPFHLGEACDGAIVQADHEEYRKLTPGDLREVVGIVDGRGIVDPSRWTGVPVRRIGAGS